MILAGRLLVAVGRPTTQGGHWCGRWSCHWVHLYAALLAGPCRPKIELYQGEARRSVLCGRVA